MDIGALVVATQQSGNIVEIAQLAERSGYDSLWIPEHPVIPAVMKTTFPFTPDGKLPEHYSRWIDPFIALSMAAAATKRIKIGTGVCLLPERETIITAKAVASIDCLSQGRFLFGVGAGWLREETEMMGSKFGSRWKRTREAVEAMRVLWTEKEASYHGEFVKFDAALCEPKPIQKPYPPALLGAHGPKALERIARTYDGWIPILEGPEELKRDVATLRKLLKDHGRNPESVIISPLVDPGENGLSTDDLKRWRDAGANRVIVFSQAIGNEMAKGRTLELVARLASTVERNQAI